MNAAAAAARDVPAAWRSWFVRTLAATLAALGLSIAVATLLSETGEVVILRAVPEDGHIHLARLWIVDADAGEWISTADPSATRWIDWLRSHDAVELERDGRITCRHPRFVDDGATVAALDRQLDEKYRLPSYCSTWIKRLTGARDDPARRVWIRLDPCTQ